MRIRKRKLWAAVLSAALLFNMTAVPAMADPMCDESTEFGDAVTIDGSGWTIKPDNSHKAKIVLAENGDGDMICAATMTSGNNGTSWGTVTVSGDKPYNNLIFYTSNDINVSNGDRITLDVNCNDRGLDDPVSVYFHLEMFTNASYGNWGDDSTEWDTLEGQIKNIVSFNEYDNTTVVSDFAVEDDGGGYYYFEFCSRDYKKTASAGGWTITDQNVAGTTTSFVDAWESDSNDSLCDGEVNSPISDNKAINTIITGATDSKDLNFLVWDAKYDGDWHHRELTESDHILIDVSNPVNGKADEVTVMFSADSNFPSVKTADDLLKIVEIKDNPGVQYEIYEEEDGDDDGDGMLWCIDFDGKTDQDKKEDLAQQDRKNDTTTKTERTQVLGDTIKMTGEKNGKKTTFSVAGLKKLSGTQKLTVNAEAKFTAEELKGLDLSKVTLSYNNADGTVKASDAKDEKARVKEVKKHLKINKKGVVQVKKDKNYASYVLTIPVENCILHLTVVNIDFNKNAIKKNVISAYSGDGSTVSVNLVEFVGKEAGNDSEFLSADWTVDNKIAVTTTDPTKPVQSKKKLKVWLSKDYRTLTISHSGDEKLKSGNVKVTALINGRKYNATVKVKINKKK